jgi:hypothetical protein
MRKRSADYYKIQRNKYFKYKHDISFGDVERMFASQKGCCPICGRQMTLEIGYSKNNRAVIDHSHKTSKRRGLICFSCNVGLGMFRDDIDILISAVVYLKERENVR